MFPSHDFLPTRTFLRAMSIATVLLLSACQRNPDPLAGAPNILFVIADDWSYPHAGVYGDQAVKTPNFDRIAAEGVLFDHAFVSSPSCTPSRAAILAGQPFWRLQQGGNLYGPLPPENPVYPDLLETAGYHVGYTGKGWGPGMPEGRDRNPAGTRYDSFEEFLNNREGKTPFCFWFGSTNPHRGYQKGSGEAAGINPDKIQLPGCFPDSDEIRKDVADYYKEVQDFDDEIGALLTRLEAIGELDKTLIVVSSDNGMPFPRCKSNVYDMGTRVPLAIRWGAEIKSTSRIGEFVSLTDLASTFLEVAGVKIPEQMTGRSLLPFLQPTEMTQPEQRPEVFLGKERHVPGQEMGDWGGYPSRAIRTKDYLYVRNLRPDRWPAGTPNELKATFYPAYYADVDGGPTRTYMIDHQEDDETHARLFSLAFEKRGPEELYDLNNDPDQLHNLADDPAYTDIMNELSERLTEELQRTKDPRLVGGDEIFESYPYTGGAPFPDNFVRQGSRYATVRIDGFPSRHIGPRTVEVLTPVNVHYDEAFPVIYMFDGQNIFHSFTGWGGKPNQGWRVDDVLDSRNAAGTLPQAIVVGIFNNPDHRRVEYMPAKPYDLIRERSAETTNEWDQTFQSEPPRSDAQLKFIVEEVKPYIDAHFKTKKDRAHTFVAGSSMGGLMSAYAICEYPEVFGGAACLSTHWPPLDGVFLEYLKSNLPDPATHKIYFDHGTVELDAQYEPFQRIADDAMEAAGYEKDKNWMTLKFEGAKHHEDDWHARFGIPIAFLLAEN